MGDRRSAYMVLVGRLKEGDHLEYLDVNKVEMDLQEVE
jgi:hypothetical protein